MKVNIFRELLVSLLVVLVISTIVLKGYTMESALKLLVANGDKYIPAAFILGTIFYMLIRRQKQQEEKEQEMKEMKMGDVASSEEIASVPGRCVQC
ncbi:hypothetical protein Ocin01_15068 [Orchesella cincta]|uniref:Uncharacterized protein n=1 Tax=Orchesella cincta TaxID=48709 RepID=A0A1D2MFF1_ORCCI|nr:hypothetical protein Ocin01_15068 [Orchesella cincta]